MLLPLCYLSYAFASLSPSLPPFPPRRPPSTLGSRPRRRALLLHLVATGGLGLECEIIRDIAPLFTCLLAD